MTPREQLQNVIKGRVCGLIAQGKSLNELEERFAEFKDLDICWVGLGQFDTVEKYIFEPHGKSLDMVFDCSSQPDGFRKKYELTQRIPRLEAFLSKSMYKLWITTHGIYRDTIKNFHLDEFWARFGGKTIQVDQLFPRDEVPLYVDVPNSLTLACAPLIAGGAKSIILFGCDGYTGSVNTGEGILSYYKPEEVKKERLAALGSIEDPGINRDTGEFQKKFKPCYYRYSSLFNSFPDVYNCSPITLYTHIRKIDYDQALEVGKGNELDIERGPGWHLI